MNPPPPTRPARAVADDTLLPFHVPRLDVRGRVARLGPLIDDLLGRHNYPRPVQRLLAEMVTLTALLATALKFDGRFMAQTTSDGPVPMLLVDFATPDKIRACARYDEAAVEALMKQGECGSATLTGTGHFALTIDQGLSERYQGVVPLEGESLAAVAQTYFRQSEQIPTYVRLAVGEALTPTPQGARAHWRTGGYFLQFLPDSPERARADFPPGDAPPGWMAAHGLVTEDAAWSEARQLSATLTDDELIDPAVSPEVLLYRLFHEAGVHVYDPQPLQAFCRCSRDSVASMLRQFPADERAAMVKDDAIHVICEFCSRHYDFQPRDIADA